MTMVHCLSCNIFDDYGEHSNTIPQFVDKNEEDQKKSEEEWLAWYTKDWHERHDPPEPTDRHDTYTDIESDEVLNLKLGTPPDPAPPNHMLPRFLEGSTTKTRATLKPYDHAKLFAHKGHRAKGDHKRKHKPQENKEIEDAEVDDHYRRHNPTEPTRTIAPDTYKSILRLVLRPLPGPRPPTTMEEPDSYYPPLLLKHREKRSIDANYTSFVKYIPSDPVAREARIKDAHSDPVLE